MLLEIQNYRQRIEDLRGQIGGLISNLGAEALNWRPTEAVDDHASNSLAVLVAHIAGAERFWVAEVVGGHPPSRDRDAEFTMEVTGAAPLLRLLEEVGSETRDVLSGLTDADLAGEREARGRTTPVRWCVLHVVDHTALHLGHMQLTYQLWANGRSMPSPFWFERL